MTEPLIRPPTASARETSRPADELYRLDPPASKDVRFNSEGDSPPATPRWVKASVVIGIALVLLLAALHLTGIAPTHGMPMHGMPGQ